MKQLKIYTYALFMACLLMVSSFSSAFHTTAVVSAATIAISSKSVTLEIGSSKTLKITGTSSKVSWSSNNKTVATVSSSGKVTAKAVGTATITATVGSKKYTSYITVKKPVTISYSTYTLVKDSTKKLYISGTSSKISWSSSNKSVATISSWGTITAVSAGTSTITAQVDGKKLTCLVTVKNPLKLSYTSYSLAEGNTKKLYVSGTTGKVTWSSSDTSVATVSSWGTVTAKTEGQTTITAQVDGKKLTCVITVTPTPNPYVVNAPFPAKEMKTSNISMVVPKDWVYNIDMPSEKVTSISLSPNSQSGSSINFNILNCSVPAPDYAIAKESFLASVNEEVLRNKYDSIYSNIGLTHSFTDYKQTDLHTNSADIYKVEYVVTVMGIPTKKMIYHFYIGQYYVEITAFDTDNSNIETITDYMLNSITVK